MVLTITSPSSDPFNADELQSILQSVVLDATESEIETLKVTVLTLCVTHFLDGAGTAS
jgi:hypothetical protein